jgi:hypothetical protein
MDPPVPVFLDVWQGKDLQEGILDLWPIKMAR